VKIVIGAIGKGDNMKRFSATVFAAALFLSLGVTLSGCGYIYRTLPDEATWSGWPNVAPRLVTDMLIWLGTKRDLYIAIEERRVGRARYEVCGANHGPS
jgi:hypothetical protein